MTKALDALIFIVCLNVVFFLGQAAISHLNPDTPTQFFNYEGSMISDFDTGGYVLDEDVESKLPSSSGTVSVDSGGNIFTDIFGTILDWFLDSTGLTFLLNIVNAFPNFIKALGAPIEIVFALGFLWHVTTLFIVISFIARGD